MDDMTAIQGHMRSQYPDLTPTRNRHACVRRISTLWIHLHDDGEASNAALRLKIDAQQARSHSREIANGYAAPVEND